MAGTQPHYHISRLKRPRKHKYSHGGLELERKHRRSGHATIEGTNYLHPHRKLRELKPPHLIHKHRRHLATGHKHIHRQHHTSELVHQHRATEHRVDLHESRSEAAKKAAATRRARGEKTGFALMTPAERHVAAIKAAATRKAEGIKPFGHETRAQRSAAAKKAAATRRAEGIKPFGRETLATRHAAALKAAATRRREGIKPFHKKR